MIINKLYNNLLNSINGFKTALKEISFKLEIFLGVILFFYILIINLELIYIILLIISYLFLLVFEIFNTAIERLCNKITNSNDDEIKKIKDLSSAGVFISFLIFLIILFFSF